MRKVDVENGKVDAEQPGSEPVATIEPGTITPEQLVELKERAAKADEHWERLLRTTADLENFKKRAAREKDEARRFANETILQKLIPVLDNFDMALAAAQNSQAGNVHSLQAGINMIHQQLKNALVESGLEEVDAAGKMFDPNLHEAVSQKETSEAPEGQVVQQMRKGYRLRDRLLRPASVVVAKAPAGLQG
jgi:molecular chaperone GrpE